MLKDSFTCSEGKSSAVKIKLSIALTTLTFLMSCNSIVFDSPQPSGSKSVTNISKMFPGVYISSDSDSISISSSAITLKSNNGSTVTGKLGKNIDIKEYSNGYVVNLSDSVNNRQVWVAYIFKLYNDTLWISYSDFGTEKLMEFENQIRTIVPYEVIRNNDGSYQRLILKPQKLGDFEKLVNAGIFNKTVSLRMEKEKH